MKRVIMKTRIALTVIAIALVMALAMASTASAALPAPNFMPNFPMLAGPQIIIMWMPVPGAVKYNIYMNGGKVAESVAMQHIQPAPVQGGDYKLQVSAVDASGAESPLSIEKVITIIMIEPPTGIAVLPSVDRVMMRWKAARGAMIYDVFRRKKGEKDFKMLASVTSTRHEDTTLEKGVDYQYAIKSKDTSGKSSRYSNPINATLTVVKAADTRTKEGSHMYKLPGVILDRVDLPEYPTDAAIFGNTVIVSAYNLFIFNDITKAGTLQDWQYILPAEKGFGGITISPDGSLLYAVHNPTGQLWVIDYKKQKVVNKITVPDPPVGVQGTPGALFYMYQKKVRQRKERTTLKDVIVAGDGTILASDGRNARIVRLEADGEFIETVGHDPDAEIVEVPTWYVEKPGSLVLADDGKIIVSSINSIEGFREDGSRIDKIGGLGSIFGTFAMANGIFLDSRGGLYATDIRNGTIQLFYQDEQADTWRATFALTNTAKNGNLEVATPIGLVLTKDRKTGFVLESIAKRLAYISLDWDKADKLEEK